MGAAPFEPSEPKGKGPAPSVIPAAADPSWDDWDHPPRGPEIPMLHLDGFDGPMDLLLELAERQRVDFGRMSILALADQFVAALQRWGDRAALERKADWLVLAARLVLLRSRLLFSESPAAAAAAQRDAADELRRIDALAAARAAASWLEARPILGQDVFPRGAPEAAGAYPETEHAVDIISFLWASLALFDDDLDREDTAARYRPPWLDLHTSEEARTRILQVLREQPGGVPLGALLPRAVLKPDTELRRRSAWCSTLVASLELARQGEVLLDQDAAWLPILVRPAAG